MVKLRSGHTRIVALKSQNTRMNHENAMPSDKKMASSKGGLPVTSKIDNDAIPE